MTLTVLIADDEHGYRRPIADMFEDAGFLTIEAESENDVVSRAPKADVWVVDVRLPSGDREGIRAVAKLVESGCAPRFPVVFISVDSEGDARDQLKPLENWGVRYVWQEKPFELELLLRIVQEFATGE